MVSDGILASSLNWFLSYMETGEVNDKLHGFGYTFYFHIISAVSRITKQNIWDIIMISLYLFSLI